MDNKINRIYSSIFLLSFTTLVYEILLIRILSVLMYYSFVSLIISLSLFGIGIGALLVYLIPERFPKENISVYFTIFAGSLLIPFILLNLVELYPVYFSSTLSIFHPPQLKPFQTSFYTSGLNWESYVFLTVFFLLISIPFVFTGITASLFISSFNKKISKLYFFDLIGASCGSFMVIPFLSLLGAPASILLNSILAFSGVFIISKEFIKMLLNRISLLFIILILFITMLLSLLYQIPKINFVRGYYEPGILYTKWNAISRVVVYSGMIQMFPNRISKTYRGNIPSQLGMAINDTGYTVMVRFDGDIEKVKYVKYLINSLVYSIYENRNKNVLLIGPGGGEEILGAYSYQPVNITAVEMNPTVVETVNERFKNFTGAPYNLPNVRTIVENARSYIRYSSSKFDIISASLVYEWFEPAAGAFSLSESNLYTLEGFIDYFNHLTRDGVLNICRFTDRRSLRFTAMAIEALKKIGVKNPEEHIFIANSYGLGDFIFKKTPFTQEELKLLKERARNLDFGILYSPDINIINKFSQLIKTESMEEYYKNSEYNLSPATDDMPFFNFLIKPSTFFSTALWLKSSDFEDRAIYVLKEIFLLTFIMTGLLFVLPFLFSSNYKKNDSILNTALILMYFGCIGFGFMLIEISFMRKFNLIVTHPTLSISLILFSMLLSGALGSLTTNKIPVLSGLKNFRIILFILNIVILIYIFFMDSWLGAIQNTNLIYRYLEGVIIIFPLSFLMGMPMPLGIKMLGDDKSFLLPWVFSINAAASVMGSVSAFIIALNFGFNVTLYTALSAYLLALLTIFSVR
ncbi:MAG: hypothetical protein HY934_10870 [Candidatus Firestonebacteria bacterium]|nr:hypothetical protein [Candidatus Firestonebacteria bacterium]